LAVFTSLNQVAGLLAFSSAALALRIQLHKLTYLLAGDNQLQTK